MDFSELLKKWIPLFLQMSCEQKGGTYALNRLKQWLRFLSRHYVEAENLFERIKRLKTFEELAPISPDILREMKKPFVAILAKKSETRLNGK